MDEIHDRFGHRIEIKTNKFKIGDNLHSLDSRY